MVTHDVHLKNVATRVLYLRDGKLSREELVSASKRNNVLRSIEEKLESMKRDKRGVTKSNESASGQVLCETRKPSDYPTFNVRSGASIS